MDKGEHEPEVKITDRRRFSREGEPLQPEEEDAAEEKTERAAEPAAPPSQPAVNHTPLPPPTFDVLVLSLRWQAELQLGMFSDDKEQEPMPDLEGARHSIDLLGMLQEKTRGNLTLEEQRLLENSLTELRFRYVEAVERFAKKK
ncbi:MAG TPA: DUF1844 domain-containing protein [Bryobacterales bacterium]|jgi:hypothetical protein|nr:DUF1844 domain-containing protein [Bryobacterales bacterium]